MFAIGPALHQQNTYNLFIYIQLVYGFFENFFGYLSASENMTELIFQFFLDWIQYPRIDENK